MKGGIQHVIKNKQLPADFSGGQFSESYRMGEEGSGNSWTQVFADEIFPAIDEEGFSVLYSEKGSRSNTPGNVIISALIIKELFDYSPETLQLSAFCRSDHRG